MEKTFEHLTKRERAMLKMDDNKFKMMLGKDYGLIDMIKDGAIVITGEKICKVTGTSELVYRVSQ